MPLVLVDLEYRMQLPSAGLPNIWIAVDGDAETAFSVNETDYPSRIEHGTVETRGFLLIVRTGRIFTVHGRTLRRG
jgi:hypothetical protein